MRNLSSLNQAIQEVLDTSETLPASPEADLLFKQLATVEALLNQMIVDAEDRIIDLEAWLTQAGVVVSK